MPKYNLTPSQLELLRKLVEADRAERLDPPIVLIELMDGTSFVAGTPDISFKSRDEFEALCHEGLLGSRFNKRGDAIYHLKQSAFDAVDNDFEIPEHLLPSRSAIGAVIGNMSGGNVQAVAQAINSEVTQNVGDSETLRAAIDELGNALIDAVRSELQAADLARYIREVEELKAELAAASPRPPVLKHILGTLSFFGAVEGTIGLAYRVAPLIQLALALAQRVS